METASFIHNNQGLTLKFTTLPALLDKRAHDTPGKPAYILRRVTDSDKLERTSLAYSEIAEKSFNLAASMLLMGIKPQDKIAVIGRNSPEYVFLENACFRLKVLMLRFPETLINEDVLLQALNKYQVRALILDDGEMESKLKDIAPGIPGPGPSKRAEYGLSQLVHIFLLRSDESSIGTRQTVNSMCNTRQDKRLVLEIQDLIDPDDTALIYPTSGSTGTPKFIMYSHFNIINTFSNMYESLLRSVDDLATVFMSDRPFSWIGGLSILPIVSGDTYVNLSNLVSTTIERVSMFIESAKEEHVTSAVCLGYMLHDMMNTIGNQEVQLEMPKRLQHILTGGEQIPSDAIEFAEQNFTRVSIGYGSSEMLYVAGTSGDDATGNDIESISWLAPFRSVQIKIVDDAERILPLGEVGNVFCRSMLQMTGYLEDPESTNEVFTSTGWYRTGDVGIINEHNHLKVVGRAKEVLSIGGNEVYPTAVESLVFKHPKVQKVVAVAVPDPRMFNEMCACVMPKSDQVLSVDELKLFCGQQGQGVNSLMIPRYYFVVKEFPLGSTGKIDRQLLTKMAITSINIICNNMIENQILDG